MFSAAHLNGPSPVASFTPDQQMRYNFWDAALDSANPNGTIVDPQGLALELAGGDGALVDIDADGNFLQASLYSGLTVETVRLTALDAGGVLMAGEATETAVLAKGTPEETPVGSPGVFVARYDAELKLDWMRRVPVPGTSSRTSVLRDGTAAFVGGFSDTLTLGAGEPNEITLENTLGERDGVVSRLDADGQLLWATQLAGEGAVDVYAVTALSDGSVWIGGAYGIGLAADEPSTLELAPGTAGAMSQTGTGSFSFVARLATDGTPAWVVPLSGSALFQALSASPRALIAAGEFMEAASLGAVDFDGRGAFIGRIGP
jgi:hypothetical protein